MCSVAAPAPPPSQLQDDPKLADVAAEVGVAAADMSAEVGVAAPDVSAEVGVAAADVLPAEVPACRRTS